MYVLTPKRMNVSLYLQVCRILPIVSFLSPLEQSGPYRNNTKAISGTMRPEVSASGIVMVFEDPCFD